jgi:phosphatidylglycerophosphatase A
LPAPGTTAGSLPAIVIWLLLALWLPPLWLAVATALMVVVAAVVGHVCTEVEIRHRQTEDPGPVVIDEVAGQWLTCMVPLAAGLVGSDWRSVSATAGAAFVLFRLLDVIKPWPVDRLERLPGAWGVMLDDLAAGVLAGALVALGLVTFGG